ncbi:phage major tail tube protein [Cetobacterium somerae]|uniref:phage major tail tube protein n=1 Tax=Cetobacterium somerae TaxID=188913 RepID=UPI00248E71F5|nr:phage major tail tube protein [Cetobacterium somerae]
MAAIPSLIADALVKVDGSKAIGLTSYNLPEVKFKGEDVGGLGTGNKTENIKNIVEPMNMSLKIRGVDVDAIDLIQKNKINLVLAAAIQVDGDELSWIPVVATVKGSTSSFKMGEITKGGKLEPELELNLDYYKLEIKGKVINEIDQDNNVVVVDGRDIYEGIKSVLGG